MTPWPRPVPLIGDVTSAAERAADPAGWAFAQHERDVLDRIVAARRDVRRYRPDPVDDEEIHRLLKAAHSAPSVGHSQPWRFVVVRDESTRATAATMADRARLAQAEGMDPESARRLLDLQLEGIREAPVGIVVCCDRRSAPAGVLGRATFHDADMWSCACAIQNLWLTARAAGLGVGWVTLFDPDELRRLLGVPDGVETLGWLCVGYPDERNDRPGLERHGWSARSSLDDLVMVDRWDGDTSPDPPRSRAQVPTGADLVAVRDATDQLLTPSGSFGVLGAVLDRVSACCGPSTDSATLVLAIGDHPVAELGVTPFARSVTADVRRAAVAGRSVGIAAARTSGLSWTVVDAGSATGDLVTTDALTRPATESLVDQGVSLGRRLGGDGLVVLGEVGVGNTTVAAALAAVALDASPDEVVGLGSGADSAMLRRKQDVVAAALQRWVSSRHDPDDHIALLAALGGPEFALLCGVVTGVSSVGGIVVLDGAATTVAAAVAARADPVVCSHLVAGQRSNETVHVRLLARLGLEPLLDLRLRAGEGLGAVMATRMLLDSLEVRRRTVTTE